MPTLVIRHIPESNPPQFQVMREGGKAASPCEVPTPFTHSVAGRPNDNLMRELRWYLEEFLKYPFPPETGHADRVQDALRTWGEAAFEALFGSREAGRFFDDATQNGHHDLLLRIVSDDPAVQSWPWEALRDPQADYLAHTCRVERCLDNVGDPIRLAPDLPRDRVNILLITARPGTRDVAYQSISGPLVELVETENLPARVHVLRPPTFDQLQKELRERPGYYHIVHFDGHGAFGDTAPGADTHAFRAQGQLVFEDADGRADPKTVDKLGPLLREHNIPCVVLNACQSGMHDANGNDVFASVATALLKAGIRSVVAMAYSLYVSGAREFLPSFYRRLFETGSVDEAVREGRKRMLDEDGRVCSRGTFPLADWLVPVLYQHQGETLDFSMSGVGRSTEEPSLSLPSQIGDVGDGYGFVGRDAAILELERALRGPIPGILVHGLGGVGKTTLAKGFAKWLARTEWQGKGILWLDFRDIRSAEYVLNAMGGPLFGEPFLRCDVPAKVEHLARAFKETPVLVVWDNFESASGIPETTIAPLLSTEDRGVLRTLLQRLRGGRTKVCITSRSPEDWLGPELRRKVNLGGLRGDDRWEYCQRLVRGLGLRIDRDEKSFQELMDQLGGHPLAMRAMLPLLEERSAAIILEALRGNMAALAQGEGEALRAVFATLQLAVDSLPGRLQPLLYPLALHESYAAADLLEFMARRAAPDVFRQEIDEFFHCLGALGVVRDMGQAIYELHPALTGFLRTSAVIELPEPQRMAWRAAFVDVMGLLAHVVEPWSIGEQQRVFSVQQANIHVALDEARSLGQVPAELSILHCLGGYAQNSLAFVEATTHYVQLARRCQEVGKEGGAAHAFHRLGMVAQDAGDLETAREWCQKALEIEEKHGNDEGKAMTYHQLGIVAQLAGDLETAREWYQKALAIFEQGGDAGSAARTYHQLGMVAQLAGDLESAREWYQKALTTKEQGGDAGSAARTYHQLGIVAQLAGDLETARKWYQKSLAIFEQGGDAGSAAMTYGQLGMVAQDVGDLETAREWYQKALTIFEQRGDAGSAARAYHQLGMVAQDVGDLETAREWYQKALAIFERFENKTNAEKTRRLLASLADTKGHGDA